MNSGTIVMETGNCQNFHTLSRTVTQLYAVFVGSFETNIPVVVKLFNEVLVLKQYLSRFFQYTSSQQISPPSKH